MGLNKVILIICGAFPHQTAPIEDRESVENWFMVALHG